MLGCVPQSMRCEVESGHDFICLNSLILMHGSGVVSEGSRLEE